MMAAISIGNADIKDDVPGGVKFFDACPY